MVIPQYLCSDHVSASFLKMICGHSPCIESQLTRSKYCGGTGRKTRFHIEFTGLQYFTNDCDCIAYLASFLLE